MSSRRTTENVNRLEEENNFSESAVPSDVDVNKSDFNETEVKELASKVSEIALEEREAALFDMHGVAPTLDEDPEMLSTSLQEMNGILTNMLCWKQASAFKLAESQAPEYTRNEKLLLMFLRCQKFHANAAATRMITFFRQKLSLFGPEKLCKETIRQSDLDPWDWICVSDGSFQLLPRRDHAGRAQLIYFPRFAQWFTHDNTVSAAGSIDVEVDILLVHGGFERCRDTEKGSRPYCAQRGERRARSEGPKPVDGMEMRAIIESTANEACGPPRMHQSNLWSTLLLFTHYKILRLGGHCKNSFPRRYVCGDLEHGLPLQSKVDLTSMCCHIGNFEEIEQQLAGFGINGITLAISCEGDLKIDRHKGMLRSLKCLEAQTSPAEDYVLLPNHTDVLLGRGKPIRNHPGNIRLSLIVESHLQNFDGFATSRQEKLQLAVETVDKMKGAGGRFLAKCDEGWKIAPDILARERVIRTFRTVHDRLKIQERSLLNSRVGDRECRPRQKKRMPENK
eukprot:scaffold22595_cov102-Cylindrotheca_fusiformis.AAC.4